MDGIEKTGSNYFNKFEISANAEVGEARITFLDEKTEFTKDGAVGKPRIVNRCELVIPYQLFVTFANQSSALIETIAKLSEDSAPKSS